MGIFLRMLALMYFPLYSLLFQFVRKKKYKKLLDLIKDSDLEIFDKTLDSNIIKKKFSVSGDYSLCFIDIFDYRQK